MLIFFESGRLGNQLFQYAALRTIAKKSEPIVLISFNDLNSCFDGINAWIISQSLTKLRYKLCLYLRKLLKAGAKYRIIRVIRENKDYPGIIEIPGFFNNLALVETSYFQGESFFNLELVESLTLKPNLAEHARSILSSIPHNRVPIFVHIRRGDYLSWPSEQYPAVLPLSYYHFCMEEMQKCYSTPFWVFTSDDSDYIIKYFGGIENAYFSRGSANEDFALMCSCKGGVLSASSFSWWAAFFAYRTSSNGLFLAPKYWAGYPRLVWYPKFIESSFLRYVDVFSLQLQ